MRLTLNRLISKLVPSSSSGITNNCLCPGVANLPYKTRQFHKTSFCKTEASAKMDASTTATTHFGFETVSEQEKYEKVYKVFENVAEKYDLMNDAMSLGVHRLWKDHFVQKLAPTSSTQLVDVAGGTGDIAFRFLKHIQYASSSTQSKDCYNENKSTESVENRERKVDRSFTGHVTVVDINQAMLDVGKQRCAQQPGAAEASSWIKSDAESLPFEDNKFDAYTIAFGIRNCTHIDKVLEEAYRVLKPGGQFMCLEFSQVTTPLLSNLYDAYSFQVIPVLGYLIAKDWDSYKYLVESIRQFPAQEEFAEMIEEAGFRHVTYENLTLGVVAIHSGFKM